MACFRPIWAYRTDSVNPETGKRGITFSRSNGLVDMPVQLPCGKCLGCLNGRTNEWALRCTHEAQFHTDNCFITLTYDDDHLPADGSLNHKHFQDFMKRLRKARPDIKIKYFMCGEYGGLNMRPHYHAIIFGADFPDKRIFSTKGTAVNFISDELGRLWPFGFHTIGNVHYGTARYTAKYSMKMLQKLGIDYGHLKPEYRKMSQGIGADYAIKFNKDIVRHDSCVINGRTNPVPRYYENFISASDLQRMKDKRVKLMVKRARRLKKVLSKVGRTVSENHRIAESNALAKDKLHG